MNHRATPGAAGTKAAGRGEGPFPPAEVVEVALLLPSGQAAALERVAHRRGLTLGQLVRRLVRDCLAGAGRP
jgi:hypothetical protein